MDQGSKKPASDILKCPLCSGHGELAPHHAQNRRAMGAPLPSEELFDRLGEKDFSRKVESYLADVVEPERKAEPKPGPTFAQDVHTWNCTHFLWRRSPKE
jgi:hypothetical protein